MPSKLSLLVLAAGMGSRYGGLKQLDSMGPSGELLLDYAVHDALKAGFKRVVFLIRKEIEEAFRKQVLPRYETRAEVALAFQEVDALPAPFTPPADRTKPWGTAHAIWCARDLLDEPFGAINADDFYGRGAFEELARFLSLVPDDAVPCAAPGGEDGEQDSAASQPPTPLPQFALVGYPLQRTLSHTGPVSRGICRVDDNGLLLRVEEFSGLRRDEEARDIRGTGPDGVIRHFEGREIVSMNCWAFRPTVFALLEEQLHEFLMRAHADERAEFYIPTAVAESIRRGQAEVRVLSTDSQWIGVTHREDRDEAASALAELHRDGVYATPLL